MDMEKYIAFRDLSTNIYELSRNIFQCFLTGALDIEKSRLPTDWVELTDNADAINKTNFMKI